MTSNLYRVDYLIFFSIFSLLTLIVALFFPILSFFLSVLGLILFNNISSESRIIRWFFIFNAVFSLSVIYLSRDFLDELNHDLYWYYNEYLKISEGDSSSYILFGDGFELGYHYLYAVVVKFAPSLSSIGLAFTNYIIVIFLFLFWLEIYILREKKFKPDSGLICALSLIFIGFVTFGYLQRQSLSFVILLYALTSKGFIKITFFVLLSTFFHLTALPIALFYFLIRRLHLPKRNIVVALTIMLPFLFFLRVSFYKIIGFLYASGLSFPGLHKIGFYLDSGFSILSTKDLLLNLVFLCFLVVRWDFINKDWRNIMLASFVLYFAFLGIPLLSERINFILFYLYGLFAYLIFIDNNKNTANVTVFKCFFVLYLFLFCFKNIFMVGVKGYEYWNNYPYIHYKPLYYLSEN